MPFTRLEYKRVWTVDDDDEQGFRTYQESEEQVRKDLQYHPDEIKNFINDWLLKELESGEAASLIGDGEKGKLADTLRDLYDGIAKVAKDLEGAVIGKVPGALAGSLVGFEETAWDAGDTGYTLTLAQGDHGRDNAVFGYQLWAKVGDVWCSDVWAVAGTRVDYRESDKAIVLTAEEAYEGKITFFGFGD